MKLEPHFGIFLGCSIREQKKKRKAGTTHLVTKVRARFASSCPFFSRCPRYAALIHPPERFLAHQEKARRRRRRRVFERERERERERSTTRFKFFSRSSRRSLFAFVSLSNKKEIASLRRLCVFERLLFNGVDLWI